MLLMRLTLAEDNRNRSTNNQWHWVRVARAGKRNLQHQHQGLQARMLVLGSLSILLAKSLVTWHSISSYHYHYHKHKLAHAQLTANSGSEPAQGSGSESESELTSQSHLITAHSHSCLLYFSVHCALCTVTVLQMQIDGCERWLYFYFVFCILGQSTAGRLDPDLRTAWKGSQRYWILDYSVGGSDVILNILDSYVRNHVAESGPERFSQSCQNDLRAYCIYP